MSKPEITLSNFKRMQDFSVAICVYTEKSSNAIYSLGHTVYEHRLKRGVAIATAVWPRQCTGTHATVYNIIYMIWSLQADNRDLITGFMYSMRWGERLNEMKYGGWKLIHMYFIIKFWCDCWRGNSKLVFLVIVPSWVRSFWIICLEEVGCETASLREKGAAPLGSYRIECTPLYHFYSDDGEAVTNLGSL